MAIGTKVLNKYLRHNNITFEQYLSSPAGEAKKKHLEKRKIEIREYKKIYYQRNKRQYQVRKYGITVTEYSQMKQDQNNKCKICGIGFDELKRIYAHIDHDHETGKVRGMLCPHCNIGIGFFKDNIDFLLNAAVYLEG